MRCHQPGGNEVRKRVARAQVAQPLKYLRVTGHLALMVMGERPDQRVGDHLALSRQRIIERRREHVKHVAERVIPGQRPDRVDQRAGAEQEDRPVLLGETRLTPASPAPGRPSLARPVPPAPAPPQSNSATANWASTPRSPLTAGSSRGTPSRMTARTSTQVATLQCAGSAAITRSIGHCRGRQGRRLPGLGQQHAGEEPVTDRPGRPRRGIRRAGVMLAPPGPASRCQAIPARRHALAHRLPRRQGLQHPLPRCGVAARGGPGLPARFLAIAHSPTAPSRDSARDDATYSGRKSGGPARTGRAISGWQLAGMLETHDERGAPA